jgi:hypothetical protein
MGTSIRQGLASDPARPPPDNWLDALSKLISGEMLVAFDVTRHAPGLSTNEANRIVMVGIFAALIPLLLWLSARRTQTSTPSLQYLVRTASFMLIAVADAIPTRHSWTLVSAGFGLAVLASFVLSPPVAAHEKAR